MSTSLRTDETGVTVSSRYNTLDDLLIALGEFGPYQRRVVFLVALVSFSTAFNNLGYAFWAATPDFHCAPTSPLENNGNSSLSDTARTNFTPANESSAAKRSQCYITDNGFNVTSSLQSKYDVTGARDETYNVTRHDDVRIRSTYSEPGSEECSSWIYDKSQYTSTIVTEWNLVCSRRWLASATQSVYMAGRIVGTLIYGHLSDRFGRRKALLLAICLQVLCSIGCALVNNVYAFLVLRFLLGIQTTGEFQSAYVIATETVGPSWRVFAGTVLQLYWAVAYMSLAGIAYLIRDRMLLQLVLSVPLLLLLPVVYWFIPETPRWLLASGRRKDCENRLKQIAVYNKKTLLKDFNISHLQSEEKSSSCTVADLFKTKNIRRTTVFLFYIWLVNSFVFYGLSLSSGVLLGGNQYLNFFLAGLVEIPANLACLVTFMYFGRPRPFMLSMMLAGISLVVVAFLPAELSSARIALGLFGKASITCSYAMVYLYTSEVYPTVMRGIGVGGGALMGRLGGVVAPLAADLRYIWEPLPLLVFGGLACVAGLLAWLLPETKGKPMPQTIEDGERLLNVEHMFGCRKRASTNIHPVKECVNCIHEHSIL